MMGDGFGGSSVTGSATIGDGIGDGISGIGDGIGDGFGSFVTSRAACVLLVRRRGAAGRRSPLRRPR